MIKSSTPFLLTGSSPPRGEMFIAHALQRSRLQLRETKKSNQSHQPHSAQPSVLHLHAVISGSLDQGWLVGLFALRAQAETFALRLTPVRWD